MGRREILRTALKLVVAAGLTVAALAPASAQPYPNRPVRIVLPFAAGGVADITARLVADKLSEKLGQRFVVENLPGAGGIAAARAVLSAPADGYTLAMLTNGTAVSVPLFKSLPFDPLKDFTPVSSLGLFDLVLVSNEESKIASLADFLAAAKAQPGKLNIGTINVGSTQNLTAELLKSTAGLDVTIVPFRSTPDAIVALLRNDVQLVIDIYAALRSALTDKKVRAIASTGTTRSEALAQVPTAQQSGLKDFDVTSWNALYAPAGTPPEIVALLNAALREVLAAPDLRKRFSDFGIEAKASTPEELNGRMRGDIQKWGAVIERAKIPQQ
jgi:tripartite-type tricarboxylate transporter receptor subunit TctC